MKLMPESVQLERRVVLRVPWVKRVEVDRQGAVPVVVDSVNLSEAGMCVRLREMLEISSALTLRLFAEASKPPVTCAGRVAWVVQRLDLQSRPPFLYDVGVEFINPPNRVRQLLVRRGGAPRAQTTAARPSGSARPDTRRAVASLMIRGRCYLPRLQATSPAAGGTSSPAGNVPARSRKSRKNAWHLVVWVDGVPCFSRRYASEREGVAGWEQFRRSASRRKG